MKENEELRVKSEEIGISRQLAIFTLTTFYDVALR